MHNRYAYTLNDPINHIDRTGESAVAVVRTIAAADLITPDPSDAAAPYKAIAYAGAFVVAVGIDYTIGVFNENSEESTSEGTRKLGELEPIHDADHPQKDPHTGDRPSNTANPAGALDSIENEKKGKEKSRPSIQDPDSEWEGAKSRPSGSGIDSTTKSKDRARDNDYVDDWEMDED